MGTKYIPYTLQYIRVGWGKAHSTTSYSQRNTPCTKRHLRLSIIKLFNIDKKVLIFINVGVVIA